MNRIWLVLGMCALAACRGGSAARQAPPRAAVAPAEADVKPQRNPTARWHVVDVQVETAVEEAQEVTSLATGALQTALTDAVRELPEVTAVGPAPAGLPVAQQVGVGLVVAWQRIDGDHGPRPVTDPASDGDLQLVVNVEVQQPQPHGPPATAKARFDGEVPLPAERLADFPVFLRDKLGQAAALAVTDALHQLWAGGLDDAELTTLLAEDATPVHQAAAAREVGERGLAAARERLEALSRAGRRDVAQVAVAALGRLGDARSVPVLVDALDSGHGEVIDAALQALADMPLPQARTALREAADRHIDPAVRKRAKMLLQPSP